MSKAKIVKKALGSRSAAGITPQELERWLRSHCESAATSNRYKAFVSLCYREGIANGKVVANPARLLRIKKEPKGRQRFLSREEYDHLFAAISQRCPEHVAEFIVSVHTGMRLSEQYTIEWGQVSFERRTIELDKTKNGDARTVHLNGTALGALRSIYPSDAMPKDRVFPREGSKDRFDNRALFVPCLAEAGIQDYVWHSNRHTMCSWLAMAGASIKEIQEAAGHKTITMSARYHHLSPEHRLSAMERIG